MKKKVKQRLLAVVLCFALLLSNNISLMASENKIADNDSSVSGTESPEPGNVEMQFVDLEKGSPETGQRENLGSDTESQMSDLQENDTRAEQQPDAEQQSEQQPESQTDAGLIKNPAQNESEASSDTTFNDNEAANNSGQEETGTGTEADVPFAGTYQDESVEVRVSAQAGVIPKDAQLAVTPILRKEVPSEATQEEKEQIENINAKFSQTQMKLEEAVSEKEDTSLAGFVAYDISFIIMDAITGEKSEIEPAGEVKVHMNFLNGASVGNEKEDANTQVRVQHLEENETAPNGVQVVDITDQADITVEEDGIVKDVAFSSDKFSVYALAFEIRSVESYASSKTVKIECRDSSTDQKINESPTTIEIYDRDSLDLSDIEQRVGKINGYGALLSAKHGNDQVYHLSRNGNTVEYLYSLYGAYWKNVSRTIYLYYDVITSFTVNCYDFYTGKKIDVSPVNLSLGKNQNLGSLEELYMALDQVEGYDKLLYAKQGNNTLYGLSMDSKGILSYKNSFASDSWTRTNTTVSFDFYLQPVRDSGSTDEYGEVHHKKQIDYLGDKGENQDTNLRGEDKYRLYLDVTGTPETAPDPADIVLVLDSSGSRLGT